MHPLSTLGDDTRSLDTTARRAGLLYLISGIPSVFSYVYLPARFVVPGDAAETSRRLLAGATAYRLGILSDVAAQVLLVAAALTFYSLFEPVDRRQSRLLVAFVMLGAAVQLANVVNLVAPLVLLNGGAAFSALGRAPLEALALEFLEIRRSGLFITQIFWGLWLLPLGVLGARSRYLPRGLSAALIVACAGYVTASVAYLLVPTHWQMVSNVVTPIGGLAEGATMLWLLVKGVGGAAVERASPA